jgi:OOP family OmpA-OmpF porin
MTRISIAIALALATNFAASAAEIELPAGSQLVSEKSEGPTSQLLPIGPYGLGELPSIWAEGARQLQAFHTPDASLTTLQVLSPLREQLVAQGYEVLFECRDVDCGGFDFRYSQDLLPEPEMHVNLGDYRFLSGQRMTEDRPEYVTLLVSRNRSRGFVHITTIGEEPDIALIPAAASTKNDPIAELATADEREFGTVLETDGMAVLSDLEFPVGSSKLQEADFESLAALADYLNTKPAMTVTLVGHTDAVGSMQANFQLSRARAASVRDRLIRDYGVSPTQVDAQGVGFLAPLASNLSEDGRDMNRRVEVVLTATN